MLNFILNVSMDIIEDQHDKLLQLANTLDLMNEDAGYIPLDHTVYRLYDCVDYLEAAFDSLKTTFTSVQNVKCPDSENK